MDETCFNIGDSEWYCTPRSCLQNIDIRGNIGGGTYGEINTACLDGDCSFIVKIIDIDKVERDNYEREISMTKIASQFQIGPRYVKNVVCPVRNGKRGTFGFIMVEKLDMTLGDFIEQLDQYDTEENKRIIREGLVALERRCIDITLLHGDLHQGNVMLRLRGRKVVTLFLIDFGESVIANERAVEGEWEEFYSNLKEEDPQFLDWLEE